MFGVFDVSQILPPYHIYFILVTGVEIVRFSSGTRASLYIDVAYLLMSKGKFTLHIITQVENNSQ